jgi:peroxiredoxin
MTNRLDDAAAVPFELPDANGQVRSLRDYAGEWLLLVFHRHLA